EDTQRNLDDLQNNVLSGVLLVMIVVVAFLGLRAGSLVGVSIPGSFLLGIMVIGLMGVTINMVVLFGLILALGLLVDSTIIVVELADRYQAEGQSRKLAYLHAAQRMAWPVIASTATTLAAFVPLLVWPGVMGQFMSYLPLTLICVLASSLFMALLFIPNLGALVGGTPPTGGQTAWKPGQALSGWTGRYVAVVQSLLPHSGKVLIFAFAVLIGTFMLYGKVGKGVEFFPEVDMDNAVLKVHARGPLALSEIDRLVREVEDSLQGIEGVESIYARSGLAFRRGDNKEDTIGIIQLGFQDWDQRVPSKELLKTIRSRIGQPVGYEVEVLEPQAGPTSGKPVQIELSGPSLEELRKAVLWLRKGMAEVGGFVGVTDTLPHPSLEWRIDIDRTEAARYGTDIATVGQVLQLVTQGIKVGEYRASDALEEMDIRVRFPEEIRDLDALGRLSVTTDAGLVPLSNFMQRVPAFKVSNINRIDGARAISVESYVADDLIVATQLGKLNAWVEEHYADAHLHPGLRVAFKGEDEDIREAEAFLSKAFMAALAFIAVILLTQFNSFYQAGLILTAVVFSTIGVLIGLMLMGQPFGVVMSGIGVISLAGIVVNNNIVLIDTYNLHRADGVDVFDAVIQTGAERLRPVLLTTATTVLGLLPMVLKMNINLFTRDISFGAPSTQYWAQLATAICGGLIFATVLTLVVTPCLLVLGERLYKKMGRDNTVHVAAAQEA
ncbi:MAG: efflux RND transporter permease subunit, partial [Oceanococcus sp.]